jgi:hypothetical protein
MEPDGTLSCLLEPTTGLYPKPKSQTLHNISYYFFTVRNPRPTAHLEDHPLSASATAYSIYFQLAYTPRCRGIYPWPENTSRHCDRNPHNMEPLDIWLLNLAIERTFGLK